MKLKYQPMGDGSSFVFHGEGKSSASLLTYCRTAEIVIDWLKTTQKDIHTILDIGSHTGSFFKVLSDNVDLSRAHKIGVDVSETDLEKNTVVNEKIIADAQNIPLIDQYADLTILRYVTQWNALEYQLSILQEAFRITKKYLLFQVPVVMPEDQKYFNTVFANISIDRLRRKLPFYYPTLEEVKFMINSLRAETHFLENISVSNISDIFRERYELNEAEYIKLKQEFNGHDSWNILSCIIERNIDC